MHAQPWDTLFKDALVFDGTGARPEACDVAVRGGRIACVARDLPRGQAREVIDVRRQWLMPGLLDIHTHFDLEVELAPGLPEAVRHGTTSVIVGNCSLGLAFGAQRRNGENPIVDCFARVENIPKPVLEKVVDVIDWDDSAGYLRHLDSLPLGANIAPFLPHSMLRCEVMGLHDSVRRDPSGDELARMEALLQDALDQGYLGLSTDALPFHYLSIDPHRRTKIPTQFGTYRELRRLTGLVRRADRVWQATPNKDSKPRMIRDFLLSSAWFGGRPLKLSGLTAMDLHMDRRIAGMGLLLLRIINSPLVRGNMHLQALAAPFRVWADGMITPLSEEIPAFRELNELDLEDRAGRRALLADPAYIERFRETWYAGKRGNLLDRLKYRLRLHDMALSRDLADMRVDRCPVADWQGETLAEVYRRVREFRAGMRDAARSDAEAAMLATFPADVDEAGFMLHLLCEWDTGLRWSTVSANRDAGAIRRLLFHRLTLPGFNDSGAHLTNMAFYDGNLRALQIAQQESVHRVADTIARLTLQPARFFGLDAGSLQPGARADVTVIDPARLRAYDSLANTHLVHREAFAHEQMVNRSDGVVSHVMINGRLAWRDGAYTAAHGREPFGTVLRAGARPQPVDGALPN